MIGVQAPPVEPLDLVARVVVAAVLGGLIGIERELSDQPAGLRTHILVSLGAALFTLAGVYAAGAFFGPSGVDPTRIAAQVVTGIGFLGAGAILRHGFNVRGLTTAAGLWVTAAVGTACGLGFFTGAAVSTALTIAGLFGFKRLERRLLRQLKPGRYQFMIEAGPELRLSELTSVAESQNCRIDNMHMDASEDGQSLLIAIRLPPRKDPQDMARVLEELRGVSSVDWSR